MNTKIDNLLLAAKHALEGLYGPAGHAPALRCGPAVRAWNILPLGQRVMLAELHEYVRGQQRDVYIDKFCARINFSIYADNTWLLATLLGTVTTADHAARITARVRKTGDYPDVVNFENPDLEDSVTYRDMIARGFCAQLLDVIQQLYPYYRPSDITSSSSFHYRQALMTKFQQAINGTRLYFQHETWQLIHDYATRDDIHGRTARTITQPDWAKLRAIVVRIVETTDASGVADAASHWRTLPHALRSPMALSMLSLIVSDIADSTAVRALPLLERLYKSYDVA